MARVTLSAVGGAPVAVAVALGWIVGSAVAGVVV
jgi:hypothetical protein